MLPRFALTAVTVALLAALAAGDGPQDNQPDKVRPIPPPGIKIPDGDRAELSNGVAQLSKEIDELRQMLKAKPALLELLPDVQIFHNAVRYPLTYDEFYDKKEIAVARQMLKTGLARAAELRAGQPSWPSATGLVVRGYKSRIDDSVQPYGLVVPETFKPGMKERFRLDFWCHGRVEKLTELNFLDGRMKDPGEFVPPGAFVLHLYGRYCNANRFAGEVDLFEAYDHVRKHYPIDEDRLVMRGFSMGGAACWQFATHYPGMWAAAAPGAGFSETREFLNFFQNEKIKPTAWEEKLFHWYDATDYAVNLFNCPTVAYSGEIDKQKQAADMMAKAMANEGLTLTHIIGPKTTHKYHPDSKVEINKLIDAIVAKGKERVPRQVRFTTFTLRYNKSHWVEIDRLDQHWERARVAADIIDGSGVTVKTTGVRALTLTMPAGHCPLDVGKTIKVTLDGQTVAAAPPKKDRSWSAHFLKIKGDRWVALESRTGSIFEKRPGLQGPIDDAFMHRFIIVRPTGKSKWPAIDKWVDAEMKRAIKHWRSQFRGEPIVKDDVDVTQADMDSSNLVLWGDPYSNKLLRALGDGEGDEFLFGQLFYSKAGAVEFEFYNANKRFSANHQVPILILPNPHARDKYVVLNSGFTFRDYDYLNNARQSPKLPDWAIVDIAVPHDSRKPGKIVDAGFFDEGWGPIAGHDGRLEVLDTSGDYMVTEDERLLPTDPPKKFKRYSCFLRDGSIMGFNFHSPQSRAPLFQRLATTYYHHLGPAGLAMSKFDWLGDPEQVGVEPADARMPASLVGLVTPSFGVNLPLGTLAGVWSEPPVATIGINAGTPAAYARPYQFFDFYDPDRTALALSLPKGNKVPYFLYLADAKQRGASVRFLTGAVRETIKAKGPRHFYHVLLIDTIRHEDRNPLKELLTKEAMASYFEMVVQRGVVCFHISNRDWSLAPVVADVAKSLGLHCKVCKDVGGKFYHGHFGSEWIMVARKAEYLEHVTKSKTFDIEIDVPAATGKHVWTDGGTNSLELLRRPPLVKLPLR
jgi:pimeloyl-ACP methyl ester carboxylesterase